MGIWDILEMEATKDKDQIQTAYRKKLAVTNPEDDPEAFMALRQAFEEAIKAAETPDEAQGEKTWDDSPLGLWMERVDDVYCHFSKRIDPKQWEALLREDVCQNLDMRIKARDLLLEYMLEHFFLPQSVVRLLDEHFSLRENLDELREYFPPQFLDVVIAQSAEQKEYPPYEYLEGDDSCDFDAYLLCGSRLNECLEKGDAKGAHDVIARMEKTGIKSPFLFIDKAKAYCQEKRFEEAEAVIAELIPQYEDLEDVQLMQGDIFFFLEKTEMAKQAYEAALKQDPASAWGRFGLAKCLAEEGQYKEANEIFCKLLDEDPYDDSTLECLRRSNERHMKQLRQELEKGDGQDQDVLFELAWCCFQNERYEEVLDLLNSMEPEEGREIEYHSLLGRSYLYDDQEDTALEHLKIWQDLLENIPDEEEQLQKKKEQLPFTLLLQSNIYSGKGAYEEALKLLDQIIEQEPKYGLALEQKGQILYDSWNLEDAIETLTRSIEANPRSHLSYLLRAKAHYRMDEPGEAFDDCEHALALYPYELTAHLQEARIFTDAGQFDQAEGILGYLEQEGLVGSELRFMEGYIREGQGKWEAAEKIYKKIVSQYKKKQKIPHSFELDDLAEVYYRLALLEYSEDMEDFNRVIRIIDKGLKENDRYVPLLEMKAHIACQCGLFDKALILYQAILDTAPGKIGTYSLMDRVCREMEQWDKALEYAHLQVEQTPTGYAYMRRGQVLTCLDRRKEAWEDFVTASRLSPDQPYIYNYMGVLLEFDNKEDEAVTYYEKAISLGEQEGEFCDEAYRNAANLRCRKQEYVRAANLLRKAYEATEDARYLAEELEVRRLGGQFDQAQETLRCYQNARNLEEDSFAFGWEQAHINRDRGMLDLAFSQYDQLGALEPTACREAAKILYHDGKCRKALRYLKKAIAMLDEPHEMEEDEFSRADYYLWAAKACLRMGNKKEAADLAKKGMELLPEGVLNVNSSCLPMIYQLVGGLFGAMGEHDEAFRLLEEALDMRKCDYCNYDCCIDALYELGDLFQQQGKMEKALEYYKEGLAASPFDADLVREAALLEKGKS